jgi:hypothetical protein
MIIENKSRHGLTVRLLDTQEKEFWGMAMLGYRAMGVPVVLGGLHVSLVPDEARTHAYIIVVDGAEGAWPELVADFRAEKMKRRYQGLRKGVLPSVTEEDNATSRSWISQNDDGQHSFSVNFHDFGDEEFAKEVIAPHSRHSPPAENKIQKQTGLDVEPTPEYLYRGCYFFGAGVLRLSKKGVEGWSS